jgi:UDP-glucose 4-epimerase
MRDLNYDKYFEEGEERISEALDYNSHNTTRLDVEQTKRLLMSLAYMQAAVRGDLALPEV